MRTCADACSGRISNSVAYLESKRCTGLKTFVRWIDSATEIIPVIANAIPYLDGDREQTANVVSAWDEAEKKSDLEDAKEVWGKSKTGNLNVVVGGGAYDDVQELLGLPKRNGRQ